MALAAEAYVSGRKVATFEVNIEQSKISEGSVQHVKADSFQVDTAKF
jgi:hypothetical protein